MKGKILAFLKCSKDYVSGQEISQKLNVSRTAVWKHINNLRKEGYVIDAIKNKGYRLLMPTDRISAAEITQGLSTSEIGRRLVVLDEVDSTNNEAKRQAECGACSGTIIISEKQTAGKGRRGRNWTSPKDCSVFMTVLLKPDMPPSRASMLTLVAAMAVRHAVYEVSGVEAMIKWPNDLVCDGKKICGILTEMSAEMDYINYVIIGIGINVNMEEFPEEIADKASSLSLCCGKRLDRNRIIASFCNAFERVYARFMPDCDMKNLMEEYNAVLVNLGKPVRVMDMENVCEGISEGINEKGELLVRKADGTVERILSGEVSVRGVYGYV